MRKKYIIELESGTHIFVLGPEGIVHIGEPDVVYETVDGMQIGDAVINAKPYTEPDLEQVKKEAYENGYRAGYVKYLNKSYEDGLNDAWDAAKKIALMDTETSENVTGYFGLFRIMENLTPMQAIEKIRQYEQKQEEYHIGDEVIRHYKNEFMEGDDAPSIFLSEEDGNFRCIAFNGRSIIIAEYPKHQYRKTGRHFPEIAAVLEKMRGEQDGQTQTPHSLPEGHG